MHIRIRLGINHRRLSENMHHRVGRPRIHPGPRALWIPTQTHQPITLDRDHPERISTPLPRGTRIIPTHPTGQMRTTFLISHRISSVHPPRNRHRPGHIIRLAEPHIPIPRGLPRPPNRRRIIFLQQTGHRGFHPVDSHRPELTRPRRQLRIHNRQHLLITHQMRRPGQRRHHLRTQPPRSEHLLHPRQPLTHLLSHPHPLRGHRRPHIQRRPHLRSRGRPIIARPPQHLILRISRPARREPRHQRQLARRGRILRTLTPLDPGHQRRIIKVIERMFEWHAPSITDGYDK